ncbi:hypothetical protein ERJ75_001149400 [Trypanosoma vivax]|nr:hypothetical protein ERJ75_001149400 [Trypanosoma vivax]
MNTGQMLRVLKDNIKRLETFQKQHDNAVATLERMSRSIPVDFSVDSEWKIKEEGNLVRCLGAFCADHQANQAQLSAFLTALLKTAIPVDSPRSGWFGSYRQVSYVAQRRCICPMGRGL